MPIKANKSGILKRKEVIMNLWNVKNEKIMKLAEKKSGKKACEVLKTSGLYVYVKMTDNTYVTVYVNEV